jgi:hypothetical protein
MFIKRSDDMQTDLPGSEDISLILAQIAHPIPAGRA